MNKQKPKRALWLWCCPPARAPSNLRLPIQSSSQLRGGAVIRLSWEHGRKKQRDNSVCPNANPAAKEWPRDSNLGLALFFTLHNSARERDFCRRGSNDLLWGSWSAAPGWREGQPARALKGVWQEINSLSEAGRLSGKLELPPLLSLLIASSDCYGDLGRSLPSKSMVCCAPGSAQSTLRVQGELVCGCRLQLHRAANPFWRLPWTKRPSLNTDGQDKKL